MKNIFVFLICSTSVLFSQNVGDSKFKIQLNETNKLLGEYKIYNTLDPDDDYYTYEVASEAHYIYYYFKDGICTGIREKIIGSTDLRSTYSLYNNILENNDFGIQISENEDYRSFIKKGVKTRVRIRESNRKTWDVLIESGGKAKGF
tara:strand:- start:1380 stop:1820 length:441 start_codon:yes stop_codon:yes gene_type:complete